MADEVWNVSGKEICWCGQVLEQHSFADGVTPPTNWLECPEHGQHWPAARRAADVTGMFAWVRHSSEDHARDKHASVPAPSSGSALDLGSIYEWLGERRLYASNGAARLYVSVVEDEIGEPALLFTVARIVHGRVEDEKVTYSHGDGHAKFLEWSG